MARNLNLGREKRDEKFEINSKVVCTIEIGDCIIFLKHLPPLRNELNATNENFQYTFCKKNVYEICAEADNFINYTSL